jgi:hypothetical protein
VPLPTAVKELLLDKLKAMHQTDQPMIQALNRRKLDINILMLSMHTNYEVLDAHHTIFQEPSFVKKGPPLGIHFTTGDIATPSFLKIYRGD